MNQIQIRQTLFDCLIRRRECEVYFCYDYNYRHFIPLMVGDLLFLGAVEDDFLLDGYSIRRFPDIRKAVPRDDMCDEILRREGILDRLTIPDIDLSDWPSVFNSLDRRGKNIIVEHESRDEDEAEFTIGRIEHVGAQEVEVRHFDADGRWQPEPYSLPYDTVTSVTFGSRYVEVFSKYLDRLPDNFGRV